MYVISKLKAKRLLHNGCEAYLAHKIDKFLPKITLYSVLMMHEFLDVFFELGLSTDKGLEIWNKIVVRFSSHLYTIVYDGTS